MPLKTDYKNDIFTGNRKYNEVANPDGSKSFVDVTDYEETGDNFGANEINETNNAVNNLSESNYIDPSLLKSGTSDLTLVKWNASAGYWEGSKFGYMVYCNGVLYGNGSVVQISGHSADDENSAYADENGVISASISNVIVGAFCESGNILNVCIQSPQIGIPNAYTADMQEFWAMRGPDGSVRLKVRMPADADGVLLKRSLSAYNQAGIAWGDTVENITNDTNYFGANKWYEDDNNGAGLTDHTVYFYKAFPYKGNVYNIANGHNENSAKAGGLQHEYTFDTDGGSTIYDTVGTDHATLSGCTHVTGKVGDGLDFDGSNDYVYGLEISQVGDYSITGVLTINSFRSDNIDPIINDILSKPFLCCGLSNQISFGYYSSGYKFSTYSPAATGVAYRFACIRTGGYSYLWINEIQQTGTSYDQDLYITQFNKCDVAGSFAYADVTLDQVRFWDVALTEAELLKLKNGGDYC